MIPNIHNEYSGFFFATLYFSVFFSREFGDRDYFPVFCYKSLFFIYIA